MNDPARLLLRAEARLQMTGEHRVRTDLHEDPMTIDEGRLDGAGELHGREDVPRPVRRIERSSPSRRPAHRAVHRELRPARVERPERAHELVCEGRHLWAMKGVIDPEHTAAHASLLQAQD